MPIAITPRRRSHDESESEDTRSSSPDMIPSSQPDSSSNKRVRLSNGHTSSPLNTTPLTNGYHPQPSSLQRETLRSRPTRRKHQPGAIVRVKLTNFMTYTAVEFFPGPSLNMVIGPNGTGKSTLVCAICLGLGWAPQHVGRAKEVSEFVKHGCQEATIEIELAKDGRKFRNNVVIRCTIKREWNKTVFSVDGRPMGKKAVVDLCRELSIQIDNLCQFLPQDKVVEFAAMTPVDLLKSTQRAVASQEMIDWHEELKDYRRKQKAAQEKIDSDQEALTNLEGRQRLQEADVERMREREQIEKRVSFLEAARPLAAYRTIRVQHTAAKDRRKAAQRELTKLQSEVEPSLRAVRAKEQYRNQIETVVRERKSVIAKEEKDADRIDKSLRDLQDKHNELVGTFDAEKASGMKHRKEVPRLELNITELKRQMSREPPLLDTQEYNERIREKRRAITACHKQIGELQDAQRQRMKRASDLKSQIQQAQNDMHNLDSQAGKQNAKLQQNSRDTAKLWEWLQNHQDEFEKPIFGPPVVECSVKDPRFADQIESLFQKGTMLTFTVQTKNDMAKITHIAEKELHVAEVYFYNMLAGREDFRPPVEADEMKRLGFEGWAIDHLNGPEPVLAMLCANVHLHATGVSVADTTSRHFEMLQNSNIGSWVTSRSSYRIIRRREYGAGATSTQVKPIRPGVVWKDQPVDLTAKRELQEAIDGWEEGLKSIKAQNEDDHGKIAEYRKAVNETNEEEKELSDEKAAKQKAIGEFKILPTKLASEEEKIETARAALSKIKERMRAITDQQGEVAMQRAQVALGYASVAVKFKDSHYNLHEAEVMYIEASSDLTTLKERNSATQDMLRDQQTLVDEASRDTEKFSLEARRLMKMTTDLVTSDDASEDLKQFLRDLSQEQTSEDLEAEIESEKARLELTHEGNDGVIKEFENRQRKISGLRSKLEEIKEAAAELEGAIATIRNEWEPRLDELVHQISDSFSNNMEQISCAGEVGVYKDDDFDQWAIQIRVKFRESEPLTTLDSHRQSGGERAVSTIFYLMSLQSLTRSPFRVVDEINQGMDPRNERLVHKRMVGIACGVASSHGASRDGGSGDGDEDSAEGGGNGGSQYFLITPKLLPDLTYERGMRVLCIASGEFMPKERERVDFRGCLDVMRGLKGMGQGQERGVVAVG